LASKKATTTKKIPFDQLVATLFCMDCKKCTPGCKPESLQVDDTELGFWKDNTEKVRLKLGCRRGKQMSKRTEQDEKQVEQVAEFCRKNQDVLQNIKTSNEKLNYLKLRLPDVAFDLIVKGYARFSKSNVLPLGQQMEIGLRKMQEKMDAQIAKMPFTEEQARALIGKRVILTAKNLSGESYEVKGTMVDVKPYAQYPWAVYIRKLRARKAVSIYPPEPRTVLGLREAK